jgi:hypothetical protein
MDAKLSERLAQMPLHSARVKVQSRTDLPVRKPTVIERLRADGYNITALNCGTPYSR